MTTKCTSASVLMQLQRQASAFGAALFLCFAAILWPSAAAAQSTDQVFEQGLDAFDRGDFGRAAVLFDQACNGGVSNACSNLAVLYMTGRGVTADPARGIAMFDAACRLGSEEGCDNAVIARQRAAAAPARPAVATASTIPESAQACLNGSQTDCVRAGAAYTFGRGIAVDHVAARPILVRACNGGDMPSCGNAGINFETGDGGPVDLNQALAFYTRACEGNRLRDGCGNLGRFYELAGDYAQSEAAYARACTDANQDYCQFQAQMLHRMGRIAEALPLYERLCAADLGSSCSLLGYVEAYRENWDAANFAYAKACRLGETDQCAYSRQLAGDIQRRADWHAERAAERAQMAQLVQSGNTSAAADYAVYQLRSGPLAREVVESARRSGTMGSINTQTLYVLASWFRDGAVSGAVNTELRARGTGLEGTFGTGTNAPGMAEARWRSANGGGASAYSSYRPASSSVPAPPTLSAGDAAAQVRDTYRTAHCQMAGSNTSSPVCRN